MKRESRRAQIIEALDGLTPLTTIAARIGVDESYVRRVQESVGRTAIWARKLGLSPEVAAWLAGEAQNGIEPEDVIRAALVDAWADATGGAAK